MINKKVCLVYNEVKKEFYSSYEEYLSEKNEHKEAYDIAKQLDKIGYITLLCKANNNLIKFLKKNKPDIILNLVNSFRGEESLTSIVPAIFEFLKIPYTGSGVEGLTIDADKNFSKNLLKSANIPVPKYQLFVSRFDKFTVKLQFPLIAKLNNAHGSLEINDAAVLENEKQLKKRLKFLFGKYHQPILVEEFIEGQELTAYVYNFLKPKVYLAENIIRNDRKYRILTYTDKWISESGGIAQWKKYHDPKLIKLVIKAFNITKMSDYGRFEIRKNNKGKYFFIDCNANTSLDPEEITKLGKLYNLSLLKILKSLINQNYAQRNK